MARLYTRAEVDAQARRLVANGGDRTIHPILCGPAERRILFDTLVAVVFSDDANDGQEPTHWKGFETASPA